METALSKVPYETIGKIDECLSYDFNEKTVRAIHSSSINPLRYQSLTKGLMERIPIDLA